jgi:hypothetical protein
LFEDNWIYALHDADVEVGGYRISRTGVREWFQIHQDLPGAGVFLL